MLITMHYLRKIISAQTSPLVLCFFDHFTNFYRNRLLRESLCIFTFCKFDIKKERNVAVSFLCVFAAYGSCKSLNACIQALLTQNVNDFFFAECQLFYSVIRYRERVFNTYRTDLW